jgi:hypothetical protein
MPLPLAEWTATLDRMTVSLGRILSDLDRHQTDWSAVTDTPASAAAPELLLQYLERRLAQWDARLTEAGELAASVERELADREAAVNRWNDVFVRWRELLERGVRSAATSTVSAGAVSSAG